MNDSIGRPTGADRRRGAVLGLAVGDAAGWPARTHRSRLLPGWTRRLRRELDTFAETESVTTLPVPFALNQDPTPLRLGPSDDAEWVAWTLLHLPASTPDRAGTHRRWFAAVREGSLPVGRIAVAAAADNLRRGVAPPDSGRRNPHHFDDSAAIRAVGLGATAGTPAEAATLAEWDAEVTHAGDGIAAARAIAAVVATAVTIDRPTGAGADSSVTATLLAELPADRLPGRTLRRALRLVDGATSPAVAVAVLDDLVDRVYSYGCAAAQTVPVAAALAVVALRTGAPTIDAILAAGALPSLADSAPALTGAVLGAVRGAEHLPSTWTDRCRTLAGCCAPALAGADLLDIVERTLRGQ